MTPAKHPSKRNFGTNDGNRYRRRSGCFIDCLKIHSLFILQSFWNHYYDIKNFIKHRAFSSSVAGIRSLRRRQANRKDSHEKWFRFGKVIFVKRIEKHFRCCELEINLFLLVGLISCDIALHRLYDHFALRSFDRDKVLSFYLSRSLLHNLFIFSCI